MWKYIIAENLKQKNRFVKKSIFIFPLVLACMSFVLMQSYFTITAYNWWYMLLMPAVFTLVPAMMHQVEERKLKYRGLYSLSVNLQKIWISKVLTATIYLSVLMFIHSFAVVILQSFINQQMTQTYTIKVLCFASVMLLIVSLWQIPLTFFLVKKLGLFLSVLINVIIGVLIGVLLVDSTVWLFCPYAWGMRTMIPIMKILPNGIPIDGTNVLVQNTSLVIPCVLSITLFIFLTIISAKWFSKLAVKS